ncbi:hypothetical protein GHT06_015185 [Daphnia sinensis]|uniref:Uncharacterized protein n=1 Tax=Daphnia sinensis TaxID=1820382 RepID=A0AAD5PWZ2_9CRUS|nr:hypothetical protein GHT06_015185 [Daphnia sinensis]
MQKGMVSQRCWNAVSGGVGCTMNWYLFGGCKKGTWLFDGCKRERSLKSGGTQSRELLRRQ